MQANIMPLLMFVLTLRLVASRLRCGSGSPHFRLAFELLLKIQGPMQQLLVAVP